MINQYFCMEISREHNSVNAADKLENGFLRTQLLTENLGKPERSKLRACFSNDWGS